MAEFDVTRACERDVNAAESGFVERMGADSLSVIWNFCDLFNVS